MSTAYVVVTIMSIATLAFSLAADVFLRDQVVANMDRAGVPRSWLTNLALLRAAGAAGLVLGFFVPWAGAAAAIGVVLFFSGAIITHLRAGWYAIGYPSIYLLLAALSFVLLVAS